MADTTTTLNPGSLDDKMGESLVVQPSADVGDAGGTLVKHPRVVPVDESGLPMALLTEATGRAILETLESIDKRLARFTRTL